MLDVNFLKLLVVVEHFQRNKQDRSGWAFIHCSITGGHLVVAVDFGFLFGIDYIFEQQRVEVKLLPQGCNYLRLMNPVDINPVDVRCAGIG